MKLGSLIAEAVDILSQTRTPILFRGSLLRQCWFVPGSSRKFRSLSLNWGGYGPQFR